MKELTPELKDAYIETAKTLKSSERRVFMARIVSLLGRGGQSYAERELGWYRGTIGKGLRELNSGVRIVDNFCARGRKPAEARRQLIAQKGCTDKELPCEATISAKLNALGYRLRQVQKSRPQKTVETDAIFEQLAAERQKSPLRTAGSFTPLCTSSRES